MQNLQTRGMSLTSTQRKDKIFSGLVKGSAFFTLIILFGIIISLCIASLPTIYEFGFSFFTSGNWDPNADEFGALIPIYGTLITSLIAIAIALPISIGIAFFLSEISPNWLKSPISMAIELLAAIPSIVYGMWGFFIFSEIFADYFQVPVQNVIGQMPIIGSLFSGPAFGIGILCAGIILSIMIIPFMAAAIRDVFDKTPQIIKESAYGIGCSRFEVLRYIILPYAKSSVLGSIMLGLGRALGETMAVTFVIGNTYQLDSISLFAAGNSITSAIANEFAEAQSELHVSALMELGLLLFVLTLVVLFLSKFIIARLDKKQGE